MHKPFVKKIDSKDAFSHFLKENSGQF